MQQITSEELSRFEEELNQFTFREIPVGSLIGSHLNLDFLYGHFNPKDSLKELVTYYYIKYLPSKQIKGFDFKKHQYGKSLPLLTFLSDRRHLFNMSYPIFEKLGAENVFCLIKNEKVLKQFKIKPVHFSFFNELPSYEFKVWREVFKPLWKNISKTVDNFITRNNIHESYKIRLKNNILGETRYIIAFEKMLDFLEPAYLLTHYDRFAYLAPLFSVARRESIPSYTMMHGVVGSSFGYSPLIADKVFVWGERQKQSLLTYGIGENKIVISGATQISKKIIGNKRALKRQLGILPDMKVIVLATNPIRSDLRKKLFTLFCETMGSLPKDEFYGFVRLHPSEDNKFYENMSKPSNVIIDDRKTISFENTFALADLVCNYNSAFAIDAIIRGLPLITINVDDAQLGQAHDFIEYGELPQAKTSLDLIKQISAYFNAPDNKEFLKKINQYAENYCKFTGERAAIKILADIEELNQNKGKKM